MMSLFVDFFRFILYGITQLLGSVVGFFCFVLFGGVFYNFGKFSNIIVLNTFSVSTSFFPPDAL